MWLVRAERRFCALPRVSVVDGFTQRGIIVGRCGLWSERGLRGSGNWSSQSCSAFVGVLLGVGSLAQLLSIKVDTCETPGLNRYLPITVTNTPS